MSDTQESLEVEVKFLVPDPATIRRRLAPLAATLKKPRVFETNIRFDTPDETLLQQKKLLRLRQDTAVRLTFKGEPRQKVESEVKVKEELEIELSDFETAALIFERLGYQPVQTYEKYRETYQIDDVELVLDEMPFGNFIELEGPEASIKQLASALQLDWDKRVVRNYLQLMAELKAARDLPFNDLTFANFDGTDYAVAEILP